MIYYVRSFRQQGYHKSKWELDTSEEHLGKLCLFVFTAVN